MQMLLLPSIDRSHESVDWTAFILLTLTMANAASTKLDDQATTDKSARSVGDDDEVDEYADAERNSQPKTLKFWAIMIGMYLSIILVALVSSPSLLTR